MVCGFYKPGKLNRVSREIAPRPFTPPSMLSPQAVSSNDVILFRSLVLSCINQDILTASINPCIKACSSSPAKPACCELLLQQPRLRLP